MSLSDTAFAVLMVGHSLFGSAGPDMLQDALRAGQGAGDVAAQITNGAPLKYNWEHSDTAEGVDARAVLPEGATSHLILTEALPLENHIKWSESSLFAQAFARLALSANPQAHIYVQETWHSLHSGTGVAVAHDAGADTPWRTRLTQDLPLWEGIVADVASAHPDQASQVALIPAGQAMARLYDEITAGDIAGLRDISALFSDDIHLNHTGHYFVAMVQYATLTGQSPVGLPAQFSNRWGAAFDPPSPDVARALQRVAFEAVQAYHAGEIAPAPATPRASAPATPAAAQVQPQGAQEALVGTRQVAVGLAGVKDWATQQPFIDVMKTARPWLGHRPGQFGGMEYEELRAGGYLDPQGWPVRLPRALGSIGTLILTDMPPEAVSLKGRYELRYEGKGVIEVAGRARNQRYGPNVVQFDYEPGPGSVDIRIQRINASDPPRAITVTRLENAGRLARGEVFNPAWITHIGGFSALRFMDWLETNNAELSTWEARPQPADFTYARGVPIEVLIALANELGTDAWVNVPHLADDTFVRRFAELVRDQMDPDLRVYVEFSNEVWNWQFAQARWADEAARARWGQNDKWMQYYGLRAAEVARIWTEVFGDQAQARLINVISSQTGWLGLEEQALRAPLVAQEGQPAPVQAFDAYAVTGYFGGVLGMEDRAEMVSGWIADSTAAAAERAQEQGLSGQAAQAFVQAHRFDAAIALAAQELQDGAFSGNPTDTLADLLGRVWPHHAAVAQAHGLDLIMYEGGTHVVGIGARVDDAELTAFFQALNYAPEMGELYQRLLEGWTTVGGRLFNAYSDVYAPTKWGSWGGLRHLDDANPRWDALVNY